MTPEVLDAVDRAGRLFGVDTSRVAFWGHSARGMVGTRSGGTERHAQPDLSHFLRASPVFARGRITTPLLLVHGDQDPVPYPQAEEMFSALHRQRKAAILLTFFGESHSISSPPNIRRYFASAIGFLRENWPETPSRVPSCSGAPAGFRLQRSTQLADR
jgi:pimeloyl-ACP methyl ester carboxylesterase